MGELLLRKYSSGYSSNCDEAIFGVQKALLNIFWEYSQSSTNGLVSDWLRAESSPMDEEERKRKMDDGVARYFARLRGGRWGVGGGGDFYLLTCAGGAALSLGPRML